MEYLQIHEIKNEIHANNKTQLALLFLFTI